jgi:hypothetical protein
MDDSVPPPPTRKRQAQRDSLFLSAELRVGEAHEEIVTRVRNLSVGGMLVDGNDVLRVGTRINTELRGIGPVSGTVAWVSPGRAGVEFDIDVDPRLARSTRTASHTTPLFLKTAKYYGTRPGFRSPRSS